MSLGSLTPAGRERLHKWLQDTLRHSGQLDEWAKDLEEVLLLSLGDDGPHVACLPKNHAQEGRPREFLLEPDEYELPEFESVNDDDLETNQRQSLYWNDIEHEEKAILAAAAVVVCEFGGRFVAWGEQYERLIETVKLSPLPLPVQKVLGIKACKPWQRYDENAKGYQAVFLALHAFCLAHLANFDQAWERPAALLKGDLALSYQITGDKSYMAADHPDYQVSAEQEAAYQEGKQQRDHETIKAWRDEQNATDPAKNGRPQEALVLPRPELEQSFSWWCLKLGFMLGSKLRDRNDYKQVIDELAGRCVQFMPLAHQQARTRRQDDRYGTTENEALPKYARWLLERGETERAATLCRMAIEYRISSKSPGAFKRELARAEKWLAK